MPKPILWIVIPCYNEEAVLPITAPLFLQKINDLAARGLPGFHACGEALDVDGACGGFNLAWAWVSGMVAGVAAART